MARAHGVYRHYTDLPRRPAHRRPPREGRREPRKSPASGLEHLLAVIAVVDAGLDLAHRVPPPADRTARALGGLGLLLAVRVVLHRCTWPRGPHGAQLDWARR